MLNEFTKEAQEQGRSKSRKPDDSPTKTATNTSLTSFPNESVRLSKMRSSVDALTHDYEYNNNNNINNTDAKTNNEGHP